MLRPGGYVQIVSPTETVVQFDGFRCETIGAGVFEIDTQSCFHCNRIVHIKPRMDPADMGGLCKVCMKYICPSCVGQGCSPFEKKLEQMEKRAIALRSYGL